jgi:UTP--glucose-1-phosphate uridylyltransferase
MKFDFPGVFSGRNPSHEQPSTYGRISRRRPWHTFLPATKVVPKEMLPLVDKPIIQYGVEEAIASGIEHIIFITGRGKGAMEDHFDISYELDATLEKKGKKELLEISRKISSMARISYVRQKEPLGLGHAVLCAKQLVGDEPFAVVLADDVIDSKVPCIKQMIDVYDERQGSVLATMTIEGPASALMACWRVRRIRPTSASTIAPAWLRKPKFEVAPSKQAIIGRYVLTPRVFGLLEQTGFGAGGELQLTDGILGLLKTEKVYGYTFEGKRFDAGDKFGMLQATVEFALNREDLGPKFREYLKTLPL